MPTFNLYVTVYLGHIEIKKDKDKYSYIYYPCFYSKEGTVKTLSSVFDSQ